MKFNKKFNSIKINKDSELFKIINNRSYRDNLNIKLDELRYITVLYNDFYGNEKLGHLIVNEGIEEDILYIFEKLYKNKYPINSIKLIDEYWSGDNLETDKVSMLNNNSSCFNYREIDGKDYLSYHALGLAVDINPINNPYIVNRDGILDYDSLTPEEKYYATHRNSDINHVITHDDLAYKLFTERGFEWGGDWDSNLYSIDYQHFEKPLRSNKVLYKK